MSDDWWNTPYGWLIRHYQANGIVVGTNYESAEQRQAIAKAYAATIELQRRLAYVPPPRLPPVEYNPPRRRTENTYTPEQYQARARRVQTLRIAGKIFRDIGIDLGFTGGRAQQFYHQLTRRNRERIRKRRVTLDAYLFAKHGHGGMQYRLGA